MDTIVRLPVLKGKSAGRDVVMGFAPAKVLHALSFADLLDEETGEGYQRPFSNKHSLDFRRYIRGGNATTPPLTFNLRPRKDDAWRLDERKNGSAVLVLVPSKGNLLAQVDCQHRLGHIGDLDLSLPFMIYLGLTAREEMEVFNIINSKAKGLSSSLLDFHAAHLAQDLGQERPELLIALYLNETASSPWHKQLDLGGTATSGLKRKASLRTMQKAVRKFLSATSILDSHQPGDVAILVAAFWAGVQNVLAEEWLEPRRHFLTKGVGVYALMGLLGDFWNESAKILSEFTRAKFAELLDDFAPSFDWSNEGPLKGLGGESGANEALQLLRRARNFHKTLT